jgi:hypothetical protein
MAGGPEEERYSSGGEDDSDATREERVGEVFSERQFTGDEGTEDEMARMCFCRASCCEWRRRYFCRAKARSGDLCWELEGVMVYRYFESECVRKSG